MQIFVRYIQSVTLFLTGLLTQSMFKSREKLRGVAIVMMVMGASLVQAAVTVSDYTINEGGSATVTVSLDTPAPQGGVTVLYKLTGNPTNATLSSDRVVISQGASSATFNINTTDNGTVDPERNFTLEVYQDLAVGATFDSAYGWTLLPGLPAGAYFEIGPETTYGGTTSSNQILEVDGLSQGYQDVATVVGKTYTVSFKASRRTTGAPTSVDVIVKAINVSNSTVDGSKSVTRTNTSWNFSEESFTFTATGTSTRLQFTTTNTASLGIVFDDLSIVPTTPDDTGAITLVDPKTPGGIGTNLSLWLKANVGVTGGSVVSAWADQSGSNHNVSQTNAANQPDSTAVTLNFNPTIKFDGNDLLLGGASTLTRGNMIVVANHISGQVFGSNNTGTSKRYFSGAARPLIGSDDNPYIYANNPAPTGFNILGVQYGTDSFWANGVSKPFTRVNGSLSPVSQPFNPFTAQFEVGGNNDAGTFKGQVAEIINYSSDVSTAELQKINTYLALKYGITLDQTAASGGTNYLSSNGTTIWSFDTSDMYEHDIFGLGRDDTSSLNQQISKSISADAIITLSTNNDFATANNGTRPDIGDGNFILLANNNADTTAWTLTSAPTDYARIAREWKVQETGTVGTVNLQIDVNDPDLDIPTFFGDLYISINGAAPVAMTNAGSEKWTIAHDFATGDTFTFVVKNQVTVEFASATAASTNESVADNLPKLLANGVLNVPRQVRIVKTGGTAGASDYGYTPTFVSIPAGSYDGTAATAITGIDSTYFNLIDDYLNEASETVIFEVKNVISSVNSIGASNTLTYTITDDDVAPSIPTVTGGPTTNNATPNITGSCTDGDSITAYVDGTAITPDVPCTGGTYTITPDTAIPDGDHNITVIATNSVGSSSVSPATAVTVDTSAPNAPAAPNVADAPDTNDSTPTITGTCTPDGDTITAQVDTTDITPTTTCTGGTYTITPDTAIPDGDHSITVTQTDAVGNTGTPSPATPVKVDTTAPSAVTVSINDGGDGSISDTERTAGVDVDVTLPADAAAGDTITVTTGTGIAVTHQLTQADIDANAPVIVHIPTANIPTSGTMTASVTLTDAAGNTGNTAVDSSTVDTAPPVAPTINGSIDANTSTPTITGTCEAGATVELSLNGTTITPTKICDTNGTFSITPDNNLTDSTNNITARQIDIAGNISNISTAVSVVTDTRIIGVIIEVNDGSLTDDNNDNGYLTIKLASAPQGDVTVKLRSEMDTLNFISGNVWQSHKDIVIDSSNWSSGVIVPVYGTPNNKIRDTRDAKIFTEFVQSSTDVRYNQLTGNDVVDPSFHIIDTDRLKIEFVNTTSSDLEDNGGNLPQIRVTGLNGANSVAGGPYTVDVNVSGTANLVTDTTLTSNTVTVTINAGSLPKTVSIPGLSIVSDGVVENNETLVFTLQNPSESFASLGTNKINTYTIINDDSAPTALNAPVVTGGPDTNDSTPTITGTCTPDGDTITAQVDGTDITPTTTCTNGTYTITPDTIIADGNHSITVTQTDDAGNTGTPSPATPVKVDTSAPSVAIINSPIDTNTSTPTITGTCEAGATVELLVNGTAITPTAICDSNGTFSITPDSNLSDGDNTITVTQTDDAGNTSPSSPSTPVTIDTSAPSVTIASVTTEDNGTITVKGTAEASATVTVTFPSGYSVTVTADTQGEYSATSASIEESGDIQAIATDTTGNVSQPATSSYARWYQEDESNGTTFTYGDAHTPATTRTNITIAPGLTIDRQEGGQEIRLHVSAPTAQPAPTVVPDAPAGCDTQSYVAFVTLFKGDGSVATGYQYADLACNGLSDATVYDGARLRFVPGTKARLEKSTDKGGMVIIIDAELDKATKFGER